MPLMQGLAPIRRTFNYLNSGKLIFKDSVQAFILHYNNGRSFPHHRGAKEFAFWYLPQIQYKNPEVQVVTLKNLTPNPFIRIFLDSGEDVLVDVDSKDRFQIHDHIKQIICKSEQQIVKDDISLDAPEPSDFGWGCNRQCICEIPGQVPCPGIVKMPNSMRRKYILGLAQDED